MTRMLVGLIGANIGGSLSPALHDDAGLIGSNIGGSLSPALHEDAFAAAGMVGHYHLMDVDALPGAR